MNVVIPKIDKTDRLNKLWSAVSSSWIAPYVGHKAQALMALSIANIFKGKDAFARHMMAKSILDRPLCGAGSAWESRMALPPEPDVVSPSVLSSTGVKAHFTVRDFFTALEIGVIFQVAGTATALVADFNKFTAPNGAGTKTAKLDGVNGTLTAPNITTAQAIGSVVHKDLGDTLNIDLSKGQSVDFEVMTSVSSGTGIPYILGIARAETNANLGSTIGFASA